MLKFETKNHQNTCYQTKGEKSMFEQIFTIFDKNWHNEEIMQESKPPSQKGSNLAEGATHVAMSDNSRKFGFTLAEVLITLAVIGVVAAITLPNVIANINERTNSERQANIAYKITQAMEQMRAHGELDGSYKSTDEFVDVLQKYLKIAKRCNANDIASCWPTAKVTAEDGEEIDISKIKTGLSLNLPNNKTSNVGLVLADGASIILSYDTNAKAIDIGDRVTASKKDLPVGMGKTKEFAYTTDVTNSIDFVMDVNGKKGPNSEATGQKTYDIRGFRAARFKGCPGGKADGYCFLNLGYSYECINTCNDITWDKWGSSNEYCSRNCWAGAKKACNDVGMQLVTTDINEKPAIIKLYPTISGFYWFNMDVRSFNAYAHLFPAGGQELHKNGKYGVMCVN